jgi:hypothetical protein
MDDHDRTNGIDALANVKAMVRAAWVLLSRLPERDARFRRALCSGWSLPIVHDAADAYGYHRPQVAASPREMTDMETVMGWMSWLLFAEGKLAVKRIIGWATGVSWRELAIREGCARRTVQYRMDRSFAAILAAFFDQVVHVEMEAPHQRTRGIRAFAPSRGPLEERETMPDAGKVFIGGEGFRFHGKPFRAASEASEKVCRNRR